jgi:hypothetical protein
MKDSSELIYITILLLVFVIIVIIVVGPASSPAPDTSSLIECLQSVGLDMRGSGRRELPSGWECNVILDRYQVTRDEALQMARMAKLCEPRCRYIIVESYWYTNVRFTFDAEDDFKEITK